MNLSLQFETQPEIENSQPDFSYYNAAIRDLKRLGGEYNLARMLETIPTFCIKISMKKR